MRAQLYVDEWRRQHGGVCRGRNRGQPRPSQSQSHTHLLPTMSILRQASSTVSSSRLWLDDVRDVNGNGFVDLAASSIALVRFFDVCSGPKGYVTDCPLQS